VCRQLAEVVARLDAGWWIDRTCDKRGKAIITHLPEKRDDAIGPSRVVHTGESAFPREGPHREPGCTLGRNAARLDFLGAVRIRHIRQMHFPAMCH
jgi:hypothetical protein